MIIDEWVCEICNEVRKDRHISVISYPLKDLPNSQRNINYCNDKEECIKGAREKQRKQEF